MYNGRGSFSDEVIFEQIYEGNQKEHLMNIFNTDIVQNKFRSPRIVRYSLFLRNDKKKILSSSVEETKNLIAAEKIYVLLTCAAWVSVRKGLLQHLGLHLVILGHVVQEYGLCSGLDIVG